MVRFSLFGVHVHIHASFWIAALVWGFALTAGEPHPLGVVFFALAVFVCLLTHELGHAVTARLLGAPHMEICLSWMGGCAYGDDHAKPLTKKAGLLMTLGGPLGGMAVAACIGIASLLATQAPWAALELCGRMLLGQMPMEYEPYCPALLLLFAVYLFQISLFWSIINLMPIYPLDGGVALHELMEPGHRAHSISIVIAMLLSMFFLAAGLWALAVLMIALGYYNYRCILVHTE